MRNRKLRLPIALLLVVAFVLGAVWQSAFGRRPVRPSAIRVALAQTDDVRGAPGRTMVLSRVLVEPGAALSLHRHQGTQIAHIQSGTLTYTVEQGSVVVHRGESDQGAQVVRTIEPGQTGRIAKGQWIVEQPSDVHRATNEGSTPVVIHIATLLKKGAPPSTPVSG
jgi:quercetin dioxygenase-like cupin family protein